MTTALLVGQLVIIAMGAWLLWSSRHDVELEADGRWRVGENGTVVIDVKLFNPGYTATRDLDVTVVQGRGTGARLSAVFVPPSVPARDDVLLRIVAPGEPDGPAHVRLTWRDGLRRRRRAELDLERLPDEWDVDAPLSDQGPS